MNIDRFPGGHVVTRNMREIVFVGGYFTTDLGWEIESLIQQPLKKMLTRASILFFDSYVIPLLLNNGSCSEVRLSLLSGKGEHIPIVANIRNEGELQYWVITAATDREELYQQYKKVRRELEERADALAELSVTDSLTGLINRRELDRCLHIAVQKARQDGSELAVMLLDVDHFKRINDNFGHAAGDKALKALAELLRGQQRHGDLFGRFGGEEFLLIVPGMGREAGQGFAERLLEAVREMEIDGISFTASIGHSQFDASKDQKFEALVKRADLALYQAKQAGRNRAVFKE